MKIGRSAIILGFAALTAGCGDNQDPYTLYRSSPFDGQARIHMATFDAAEKNDYNQENCETVRGLLSKQPGIRVRYWCEKGRYRK